MPIVLSKHWWLGEGESKTFIVDIFTLEFGPYHSHFRRLTQNRKDGEETHACLPSCFSHIRLYTTLQTVACQAPLSMRISRQGVLPDPGIKLTSQVSCIGRRVLYHLCHLFRNKGLHQMPISLNFKRLMHKNKGEYIKSFWIHFFF